jgi:hypothetical protein
VYNADLYPGLNPSGFVPMEWCQTWPLHFDTPSAQPEIIVRGDGDPYSAAGAITECTWNFATPTKERRGDESVVLAGVRCVACENCRVFGHLLTLIWPISARADGHCARCVGRGRVLCPCGRHVTPAHRLLPSPS